MTSPLPKQAGGSTSLPTIQTRIGNRLITPKTDTSTTQPYQPQTERGTPTITNGPVVSDLRNQLQPVAPDSGRVDRPGFGMPQTPSSPTDGGLMGGATPPTTQTPTATQQPPATAAQTSTPATPDFSYTAPEYQSVTGGLMANSPQLNWTPAEFKDHGYSAETTKENYSYDPRKESLTSYHLEKLLDPNSDLMRRAIANANSYSAGRGLQSSSIAAGAAQGAMIDRATPIAAQDAGTYKEADQLGWNNSFKAEQANADRANALTMVNAQGAIQNQLQNNQMSFQAEMQDLQFKQSLGMLDAQGAQRLQELSAQQSFQVKQLERESMLTQQRDVLLNQLQQSNMDKTFLQQLEMTQLQWQRDDAIFAKNIDANSQAQYRSATAEAYNRYLEQISAVYSNSNMTPEQQANAVKHLEQQWKASQEALRAIFGYSAPATPGGNSAGVVNPTNPDPGSGVQVGGGSNGSGSNGGGGGYTNPGVRPPTAPRISNPIDTIPPRVVGR